MPLAATLFLRIVDATILEYKSILNAMSVPTAFTGEIPENYDTYLGPLLFAFSAEDLAKRVGGMVSQGEILEVACGTGVSTEFLRRALKEDVSILATDVSDAMLAVARRKRGNLQNVSYEIADATNLSFGANQFDGVVCQFGVMFFPDKKKGLSEMFRVTKPGGAVAFNVWDSLANNQVIRVAQQVITKYFVDNPPKFLEVPFGFNDVDAISTLMKEVGYTDCKSTVVSGTIDSLSAEHIARGVVTGNPTIVEVQNRATADAEEIIKAVAEAIEERFGKDNPKVTLQEIVFTGVKPA